MTPIYVPVKPYIQRCMSMYLPEDHEKRLVIDNTTIVGRFLIELLDKRTDHFATKATYFPVNVRLYISQETSRKYGSWMNVTQTMEFNAFMSRLMREKLRTIICTYMSFDNCMSRAIAYARQQCNLPEELYSDDAIIKDFQRYRKQEEDRGRPMPRVYRQQIKTA